MNREEALELVKSNVKRRNVFLHMIAVEALMKAVAEHLGDDKALWGITGLLHDIDYERTADAFEKHGLLAQEILDEKMLPQVVLRAIKAHNHENTGVMPETRMEKALISADAVSGLIIACALVMPSKKARDVELKTVEKKFKDKDFARGADRQRILMCEEIGIPREEFFLIALRAIQSVGQDLGI